MLAFRAVSFGYSRRRGPVLADFSYRFPSGRTVLLGPNGAGKSTLMALAVGWRTPQAGTIGWGRAEGSIGRRDQAMIGFVPQDIRPMSGLTVADQVAYAGWLKGMRLRDARARCGEVLDVVGLADERQVSARALSGGQLRRLGLAMALVHSPSVMVLDEPTAGLDPSQRANFRALMSEVFVEANMIVSTHQVDDIEAMYTHVVVLVAGRVAWSGSPPEFLRLGADGPHQAESAFQTVMRESGYES